MRYLPVFLFLLSLTLGACEQGNKTETTTIGQSDTTEVQTPEPLFFHFRFKESSPQCETNDSMRCAKVTVDLHLLKEKEQPMATKINEDLKEFLLFEISQFAESGNDNLDIGGAAKAFVLSYEELMEEEDPMYVTPWNLDIESELLELNDQYFSIGIDNYSYTGGAHPNYYTSLLSFNLKDGSEINLAELITDEAAFTAAAERAFRTHHDVEEGTPLSELGFFFNESFSLPQNMAIQEEGILLIYNPYEAAPYALGSTELLLPYEEIDSMIDLSKIKG